VLSIRSFPSRLGRDGYDTPYLTLFQRSLFCPPRLAHRRDCPTPVYCVPRMSDLRRLLFSPFDMTYLQLRLLNCNSEFANVGPRPSESGKSRLCAVTSGIVFVPKSELLSLRRSARAPRPHYSQFPLAGLLNVLFFDSNVRRLGPTSIDIPTTRLLFCPTPADCSTGDVSKLILFNVFFRCVPRRGNVFSEGLPVLTSG